MTDLIFIFDELAREYGLTADNEDSEYLKGKADAYERVATILKNLNDRKDSFDKM